MQPIVILVPAAPVKEVKVFDIRDYKMTESITLTGLIHRGIDITLVKTSNSTDVKNKEATKILSYLMNPCVIYDTEVHGDCVLRIDISENSPLKPSLPTNRGDLIKKIASLMEDVYREKDSKKMPDDLSEWCKNRDLAIRNNITRMKNEGKSVTGAERALLLLKESVDNFGVKRSLQTSTN